MDVGKLIDSVGGLFSLPEVCQQLTRLLAEDRHDATDIAELISCDPVLTARLFDIVNKQSLSGEPAETVSEAVARIDTDDLRWLLSSTAATSSFEQVDTAMVDMENFWHHSVCCGLAAESLARRCRLENPQRLFVAGLMHDIGQLVIYQAMPELAVKVLEKAGEVESFRYRAEKEIMGITHAEVGGALARRWRLPAMIEEVLAFHHEPRKAVEFVLETSIVHISTAIANCVEPSWKMDPERQDVERQTSPFAWQITDLAPSVVDAVLGDVGMESLNVLSVIDPRSAMIY